MVVLVVGLVASGLLSVALAACGSSGSSSAPAKVEGGSVESEGGGPVATGPGGDVTIRSVDDVDTFDPATTGATNLAVQAIALTYDRLVYLSPTGEVEPYLAKSWTTTPTSATFRIATGAKCDDGTPVTPEVVANSLRYSLAASTAGPYAGYVLGPGKLKSVTADEGAGTVTVTLTKPYNALVMSFATAFPGSIICPAGLKDPKSLGSAPNGSGPYELDAAASSRGSSYVFNLRKGYDWGPTGWTAGENGVPSKITISVTTDENTAANMFTTGQVDVTPLTGVNEQRVAATKSDYSFRTQALQVGSWGTVMNEEAGLPGADRSVREAVFMALDNKQMVKAAFSAQGIAFDTMLTPNMKCYNKAVGRFAAPYDPTAAKKALEEDGYAPGADGIMAKDGKKLSLRIAMWNATGPLGEYMQEQLRKVGIESTVKSTDVDTWVTALFTTKAYDLTVFAYYSSFPNPAILPAQDSALGIKNQKYYALASKATAAPEGSECAAWDQALAQPAKDFNVRPMGVQATSWFANGWKFQAAYGYLIDPFTLFKTE
ncbi:MAG: ABC transporter substrate-binding protein [Actinobacteria bacterium]|nr:ABC transporter substrate-binding protein [Actinomycetota bacterium]